jgi:DNA repair exonuclease SbcCD nuclease subunit
VVSPDGPVAARFAQAGRRAVEALVNEVITSKAAFLIIAGDIFDGDWKDVATGLFFVRAISQLHRRDKDALLSPVGAAREVSMARPKTLRTDHTASLSARRASRRALIS